MKKSVSIPERIVIALLLAALAVGCALAGRAAKTPEPAPTPFPTPTPIPTSELQPAEDRSGLLRDENVSFTLKSETLSLAAIRENAAHLRAKREAGEKVNKGGDYIEALLVHMTVRNNTGKEIVLCRPELETLREGVWYRLDYELRMKTDDLEGPLRANAVARGAIPLADLDGGYLIPGEYRVCIPYYLGKAQGEADHVAVAEFTLAETLEPQSLAEACGRDPELFRQPGFDTLEFSGPLGLHTLHKGEEGFTQVLEYLDSLRGFPAYFPHTNVHCSVKLSSEDKITNRAFLAMDYDGERVYATLNQTDYLALETEERPDLELEALFARYAKAPDLVPYDPGKYVVDGLLRLAPAWSVIDHDALQEAIDISLRRYTEPQPEGESVAAEEEAILWLTAENVGEKTIYYDPPLYILALRDGEWYWVRLRYNFMSDLILRSLAPGETVECAIDLQNFDDPLEPGQYCVCMFYTVNETGKSPYDHVAFAPFVITDGEPLPAPGPTPDDGTEPLVKISDPDRVDSITYELTYWPETYYLSRGDEGFEEALEILLSLRGTRCEKPEVLRETGRTFNLDPRVELAFDGERLYGASNNGYRWLLLDTEGRPDQELSAIFERYGRPTSPLERLPANHRSHIVDEGFAARTEQPAYALEPMVTIIEEMHETMKESGGRERDERTFIPLILENHMDEDCIYGGMSFRLEFLQDGEWYRWANENAYFAIGLYLHAGEELRFEIPMETFRRHLIAGHYRFAFEYSLNSDETGKRITHVAFAEFDLTDGAFPEAP